MGGGVGGGNVAVFIQKRKKIQCRLNSCCDLDLFISETALLNNVGIPVILEQCR